MFAGRPSLPTLDTQRLRLRHPTRDDAPALVALFSDPQVLRYWGGVPLRDLPSAEDYVRQIDVGFDTRSLFQWAITRHGEDRLLGTVTLLHFDTQQRRAELGYALASGAWGHGYGTEAVDRVVTLAFAELALRRLEADVDPRNARSLGLLARLGFQREGLLRERWEVEGELQDSVLLGLLARERRPYAPPACAPGEAAPPPARGPGGAQGA